MFILHVDTDDDRVHDAIMNLAIALNVSFQTIASAISSFSESMTESAESLKKLADELIEHVESDPVIIKNDDYIPHYKHRFNMPKQTYFPKVRATARSTC